MIPKFLQRAVLVFAASAALAVPSFAQPAYPAGPIKLVVPFAPGGATDTISRIYAEHASKTLGRPVVVDNVTGAGGTIGSRQVMAAEPNGHTLLLGNLGTHVASLAIFANPGYDPKTDFKPVSLVANIPMFVAAKKALPVKNFQEFAAYLRANPGKVNYGSAGVGSTAHMTCLYMEQLLGAKTEHVPYPGSGPALQALLGGHIDFVCDAAGAIVPQIQSGNVNGLVVTGRERVPALPMVPTSEEAGLAKFIVYGWTMIYAPKGTPDSIVERVAAALKAAGEDPAVRKKITDAGAEPPRPQDMGPRFATTLLSDSINLWVPLMKAGGVVPK